MSRARARHRRRLSNAPSSGRRDGLLRPAHRRDRQAPVPAGDRPGSQSRDAAELDLPARHGGPFLPVAGPPLDQGGDRGHRSACVRLQAQPWLLPGPRAGGPGAPAGGTRAGAARHPADRRCQARRSQQLLSPGPLPVPRARGRCRHPLAPRRPGHRRAVSALSRQGRGGDLPQLQPGGAGAAAPSGREAPPVPAHRARGPAVGDAGAADARGGHQRSGDPGPGAGRGAGALPDPAQSLGRGGQA